MISLQFSISNPWGWRGFKNIFCRAWPLSTNKNLEFQITRYDHTLIELGLDINWWGQDHAGPRLEIGLLGYYLHISFYDSRHWNRSNNGWGGLSN